MSSNIINQVKETIPNFILLIHFTLINTVFNECNNDKKLFHFYFLGITVINMLYITINKYNRHKNLSIIKRTGLLTIEILLEIFGFYSITIFLNDKPYQCYLNINKDYGLIGVYFIYAFLIIYHLLLNRLGIENEKDNKKEIEL